MRSHDRLFVGMESWVLTIVVIVLVVGLMRWFSRPHTAIALVGGRVQVRRGRPPSVVVQALDDVARGLPEVHGQVLLSGAGDTVEVTTVGLGEGPSQRVRNVVLMHKARIR